MRGKKAKLLKKLAKEATQPQPAGAPTHRVLRNRLRTKTVLDEDGFATKELMAYPGTLENLPTTERGMYLWLKKKHT